MVQFINLVTAVVGRLHSTALGRNKGKTVFQVKPMSLSPEVVEAPARLALAPGTLERFSSSCRGSSKSHRRGVPGLADAKPCLRALVVGQGSPDPLGVGGICNAAFRCL